MLLVPNNAPINHYSGIAPSHLALVLVITSQRPRQADNNGILQKDENRHIHARIKEAR
jgi:hypothetical protein